MNRDQRILPLKTTAIGAVAVGLTLGLGACTPAPQGLSCTTIFSIPDNTHGRVTVKTIPGAKVLIVANYFLSWASAQSVTDSSGVTQATFDLTRPIPGDHIDVAAVAVSGSRYGSCSGAFTKGTGTTSSSQPGVG